MSGPVLGIASFALVLGTWVVWMRRINAVRIPHNRGGFVAAMAVGVLLGVAAFSRDAGLLGGVLAGFAVFAGAFFVLLVSISRQRGGSGRFEVGAPLPAFSAQDDGGGLFEVSSDTGRPLLLKFFRGHW